jgi:hypothetical protein
MSRGRDYVTREELVETIRERFRAIEEVGGGNGQAEGGGAVGSSLVADRHRVHPRARVRPLPTPPASSKTDPARGTKPGRCVRLVSLEPVASGSAHPRAGVG